MYFNIVIDDHKDLYFSPNVQADKLYSSPERVFLPSVPLAILEKQLQTLLEKKHKRPNRTRLEEEVVRSLKPILKTLPAELTVACGWYDEDSLTLFNKNSIESLYLNHYEEFRNKSRGRQIAEREIAVLACEMRIDIHDVIILMQISVHKKEGSFVPAVYKGIGGWKCQRCGEKDLKEWPGLWGTVRTCLSCTAIGAVNSTEVLYRGYDHEDDDHIQTAIWSNHSSKKSPIELKLTKVQENASNELKYYLRQEEKKEILVWAACGAGKTEVCFSAVEEAINIGKKVVFAAPRQDVIRDLVPRFKVHFPDQNIRVLSGHEALNFRSAQLTIATTHQLLRLYKTFDLVVLDEMDAYPYSHSTALRWGMLEALKETGRIVYLTATPSEEILTKVSKGHCCLTRLPVRYHRQPLPEPHWCQIKKNSKKAQGIFVESIERLLAAGTVLLFVPVIEMVDYWVKKCQALFPELRIAGSHSKDPDRGNKVRNLLNGGYELFISTMILERGITIDGVQVAVIEADHTVFDKRALVQMAGRAGRTAANPRGIVLFIAERNTQDMKEATHWIQEQNRIAEKEGLLSDDTKQRE